VAEFYLDSLAYELIRTGWAALPRYSAPQPALHVFAPAVPSVGESISVAPAPGTEEHWYRSSTGSLLAPCTQPRDAARAVIAVLSPWVKAVIAQGKQQRPNPAREEAEFRERIPGVLTWWGEQTRQWWALVRSAGSPRLVAADSFEELARIIAQNHP
jgi:hypothetical protein